MKSLRVLIMIISTLMFLYQLHTAVLLLFDPPVIEIRSKIDIAAIDLPLITICTTDQSVRNKLALNNSGYHEKLRLIQGDFGSKKISWTHKDKTFDEILNQVYDADIYNKIKIEYTVGPIDRVTTNDTVFIPAYGLCLEIHEYNPNQDIKIGLEYKAAKNEKVEGFRVFITDRNFRSHFSPDYQSHRGDIVQVTQPQHATYDIDVSVKTTCELNQTMEMKDSFKTCVDNELQKQVTENVGCTPPWMTMKNQCTETYPKNYFKAIPDFEYTFIDSQYWFKSLKIESDCRKYCVSTTSTVTTRSKIDSGMHNKIY